MEFWVTAFIVLLYRWLRFCCVGVSSASQRKTERYFKYENKRSWHREKRVCFQRFQLILNSPYFIELDLFFNMQLLKYSLNNNTRTDLTTS